MMQESICERCGGNHAGSYGEYWYGTTLPHFKILGHEQVFICNRCLQDTLLREELWLSGLIGFLSSLIYGLCNYFLLHSATAMPISFVELLQGLALIIMSSVVLLLMWNITSYMLRVPIWLGWLRITRQSPSHIRDLLAISLNQYHEGYVCLTRSQYREGT